MSEPYLGELRLLAFNFAPRGWAFCEGQILPINTNQSLYSLLGTMYGGDGRTSFALPDLRGRVPLGSSSPGATAGTETVVLTTANVPAHSHTLRAAAAAANQSSGAGGVLAEPSATIGAIYSNAAADTSLNPASISTTGGQGHDNMMPSQAIHWAIALQGLFPSRN